MNIVRGIRKSFRMLYLKIVREKASPEYIARGWAIGMFYGCLMPFGAQLICSIPTAFLLRGSKIGAALGTLLTNHITIFFIYPAQCWVGNKLMGGDLTYARVKEAFHTLLTKEAAAVENGNIWHFIGGLFGKEKWADLLNLGWEVVIAFFLGGALLTLVMTPVTYVFVLRLIRSYRAKRAQRHQQRSQVQS